MYLQDGVFVIVQDIPLGPNGPYIKKGSHVALMAGIFYSEVGGPFPEDIQYAFQDLLKRKDRGKWIQPENV